MSKSVKPTKTEELLPFAARKLGANLVATTGKERYSRRVTMEEGETIFQKIERYNKRPSETGKKAIIKLLTPEAVKAKEEKEKIAAKTKGVKSQLKKAVKRVKATKKTEINVLEQLEKLLSEDSTAVDKLQELLNKYKKVEELAPKPVLGRSSHGEY